MDKDACRLPPELFRYGGLAVPEGVMMRGRRYFAIACRLPDGTILVDKERLDSRWLYRLGNVNIPFVRGIFALLDTMTLGIRSLLFASQVQVKAAQGEGPIDKPQSIGSGAILATAILSFVFALLLFKALPTYLTQFFVRGPLSSEKAHLLNLCDGLIRSALFLGYLGLVSRDRHVRRLFMYHGAEHKSINTLESGQPLTVENTLRASRIHPRCGTSFAVLVLFLDLVTVTFLPRPASFLWRFLLQTSIVPIIASVGYEYIRLAMRLQKVRALRWLLTPTLAAQYLTTREPEREQVEVALAALYEVLKADGYAAWIPQASLVVPESP
ncbi:predicted metal-dependent enzyme [Chthonomonas calidirosea]|uniref:Predicted metal-dependent enzyme n=1 Tax=Chthonomonas calidirosea (strain DSM 23976 / ICMP 18418 / T49) TaxID=1303518 RepID=S0ES21_CHTCT|nr:DUF1385 domain-containing protein [Chthonomonas calidirosea]CCW33845.1 Predicted metal-dependent enzyme [Chthonomonas calidirosea T49]CEK16490.1 predicted metal-dependent enzyme [Chthonomonas calidirosea]